MICASLDVKTIVACFFKAQFDYDFVQQEQ